MHGDVTFDGPSDFKVRYITGSGGPASPTVNSKHIWVIDSSVATSTLPNNVRYVPLGSGASDYMEFQIIGDGDVALQLLYSMSSASANSVTLRIDTLILGGGDDPTTSPTVGTPFAVTPGANVTLHSTTGAESADLPLTVSDGDLVYVRVTRTDSSHPGDFRVFDMRIS